MLKHLLKASLDYRLITLAAAIAVSVYGLVAAWTLPVDVLPDLNKPTVSILTEAHGLAPEEVEAQITAPIENAINGAAGVERIRSVSGVGLSIVHVEFAWSSDILVNRQTVQERLATLAGRLPERVVPQMGPIASLMGEIMLIGLAAGEPRDGRAPLSPMDIRSIADWTLRPGLLSIPGVASVTVMGGEVRQFQVRADPERLRLHGLTLADLEDAVRDANTASGGGVVFGSGGGTEMVVRNIGRITSAEQLESALVATRVAGDHSVPVRVRDVARVVEQGMINKRGDSSMMARPAVIMAIAKQPGADSRRLTEAIDARLDLLRRSLPAELVINPYLFRQSAFIQAAVSNVIEALRDGSVLVVIVLALFLLNLRITVITLTAIPLSLLVTFIVFKALGQSINTMTLGGIAVAMGELVDDAIVGVENVFRRLKERRAAGLATSPLDTLRVVLTATSEVRGPILIGTTIVMLVFLPLFFLPGLAGRLFTPLAWAYIVSIFASMIVSLTVTPVLAYYLLGSRVRAGGPETDGRLLRLCKRIALAAYNLTLDRTRLVLIFGSAAVVAAALLVTRLGSEFLPPFNEGTAVVSIASSPGTSLQESNRIGAAAERLILEIPEVRSVARRTGRAEQDDHALGVEMSEIEVDFFRDDHAEPASNGRRPPPRLRHREEVFADIRERLGQLPIRSVSVGQPIGHRIEHLETGVQAQIVIKIAGPELAVLRELGAQVRDAIDALPGGGVVDLQVEAQVMVPQVRIHVDPDRAARYGFRVGELIEMLETALGGKVVSQVLDGLRSYDLVVMLDDPWVGGRDAGDGRVSGLGGVDALGQVRLLSPSGAVAIVSDVADIREQFAPNQISRENGQRRLVVSCNVQGRDLGQVATDIARTLDRRVRPPEGYTVAVEGQFEAQRRASRIMLGLGALSLLMTFILLTANFGSSVLAAQVMLNVPFAFIGAVLALWVTGEPLSLASLIGFISLCGISVRNGVLMLSHYLHLAREEGMPFGRDLVIRGSQERVAPVLMTALTTGLGLLPLIISGHSPGKEVLYPVAVVVLGGLLTSTLLDFLITPSVFLRYGGGAIARLIARRDAAAAQPREVPHV
jgi:CzcA family heavy metal efflux pump